MEFIYHHYFHGKKKLGNVDKGFLKAISGPFLYFNFAAHYNALSGWESRECGVAVGFSYTNTIGR